MYYDEIKDLALESASIYLKHCKEKSCAIAINPIKKIEKENLRYIFFLSKDMSYGADKEKYDIRICGKLLNKNDYHFLKYDGENRRLFVSFNIKFDFLLTPQNTQVESDLLFLIENVKKWYDKSDYSISKPNTLPNVPSSRPSEKYTPSDEQMNAVTNIKTHALSYIWGAPGTGKTQFVLARCIADYIQKFLENDSKHKIIVSAPTNNALEQILFGVFKVLEAENISTDLVIRLGMPSQKFASQYPNSCERLSVENEIEKIEDQINELKSISIKREEIAKITELRLSLSKLFNELLQSYEVMSNLLNNKAQIQDNIDNIELELSKIRVEIYETQATYNETKKDTLKLKNRIIKKQKALLQYKVDKLNVDLHKLNSDKENMETKHIQLTNELNAIEEDLNKSEKSIEDTIINLVNIIKNSPFEPSVVYELVKSLTNKCTKFNYDLLDLAIYNCDKIIKQKTAEIYLSNFGKMDDIEIANEIDELTAKYNELNQMGKKAQIAKANVIALTADRFILEYELLKDLKDNKQYGIEHIFIDEAAYLSMIKGLILLSLKKPTTLLGDHMQLPPVFDCPEELIKENPCLSLWEIPIIYFEELLKNDFNCFLKNYNNNVSPKFEELSKSNLNTTFRFGNNLASILAGTVYSEKFHSANEKINTSITTINAVKIPSGKKRVSPLEVLAIRDYVNLYSDKLGTYSVLTPYKMQLFELQKSLSTKTNCMTIHASQGQEWDTVIISAVDTFMSRDIKIINTAVSRAKKHLVIVCDAGEWKMHPKYLIAKIVSQADKIVDYKHSKES